MARNLNGLVSASEHQQLKMATNMIAVIILIAMEIVVAAINIVVDLYAGEI